MFAISSVARVTEAGETPHCVSALCIPMTDINFTLIDVCTKTEKHSNLPKCVAATIQIKNSFTTAVQSISIQLVPCVTATDEAPNSVSTIVFTASVCIATFVNVCGATRH